MSKNRLAVATCALLLLCFTASAALSQQLVQRGPFGKPSQLFDETQQWTTPLMVASDKDVEIYIPDVSSTEWLKRNYQDFEDRGQYVISLYTFYLNPKACRKNQIGWGLGDADHLDACNDISYRVRQTTVDTHLKLVTLIMAAMIDQTGQLQPNSVQQQSITRPWSELDANTQAALDASTKLVTTQMKDYDRKLSNSR